MSSGKLIDSADSFLRRVTRLLPYAFDKIGLL